MRRSLYKRTCREIASRQSAHAVQDVVQFGPLGATLLGQVQSQPGSIPAILAHVGALPILDWTRHFLALGAPTLHRSPTSALYQTLTLHQNYTDLHDACGRADRLVRARPFWLRLQ